MDLDRKCVPLRGLKIWGTSGWCSCITHRDGVLEKINCSHKICSYNDTQAMVLNTVLIWIYINSSKPLLLRLLLECCQQWLRKTSAPGNYLQGRNEFTMEESVNPSRELTYMPLLKQQLEMMKNWILQIDWWKNCPSLVSKAAKIGNLVFRWCSGRFVLPILMLRQKY